MGGGGGGGGGGGCGADRRLSINPPSVVAARCLGNGKGGKAADLISSDGCGDTWGVDVVVSTPPPPPPRSVVLRGSVDDAKDVLSASSNDGC